MQQIVNDFNKSQNSIVVQGVSSPDSQKQLASMASTSGSFDVSDSFNSLVGAWASKGIVAPLDQFMAADHYDTSDFVSSAMSGMRYQGKTYSLPIALGDYELLYNKKLFAAAGISAPPATDSEWAADIARLTKTDSSGKITQLGFGGENTGAVDPGLLVMAYSFGGNWFNSAARPDPANPGNIAAVSFFANAVTKRYGVSALRRFVSSYGEYASPQNPFLSGKIAMAIDGEWMSQFAQEYAPNLDWGVAPIPYPDNKPGLANTVYVQSSTLFIPENSQHKQQAWDFIKFALSKPEMLKFTKALGNLPARTSLLSDPAYSTLPNFAGFASGLKGPNQRTLPSATFNSQYITDIGSTLESAAEAAGNPAALLGALATKTSSYAGS